MEDRGILKKSLRAVIHGLGLLLVGLIIVPLLPVILVSTLVAGLWSWFDRLRLRRGFEAKWGVEGRDLVVVYSNSPHWRDRFEREILPRIKDKAVVLNWSERSTAEWKRRPLEVRIFRRWGGHREFNPIAIVFSPGEKVRTIRFWQAYRDFRHGKPIPLRRREAELFDAVGVPMEERPEVSVTTVR
jgi:hypothetical protein